MKERFRKAGIIPVLVLENPELAVETAQALIEGGLNVLEITLRTEAAWKAAEKIIKHCPDAITGLGTVTNTEQLQRAKAIGAAFAISPGLNPQLVEQARKLNLEYLPGVATPSEIMAAQSLELDLLKFFPAEAAGGIPMLKSLASPFASVAFCPTGGINSGNILDYLMLPNVLCVGGSWIATGQDIESCDWNTIVAKAESARALVKEISHSRNTVPGI